jgi:hypothetical protein
MFTKEYKKKRLFQALRAAVENVEKMNQVGASSMVYAPDTYAAKGINITIDRIGAQSGNTTVTLNASVESFSDTFTSNFNRDVVFGRTDPIPSYQNTQRVISFQIALAADSFFSGFKNLRDVNTFVQMSYPNYTDHGDQKVFSQAPLIRMRWVGLVHDSGAEGLVGTLGTITHTPDLEAGFFEYSSGSPNKGVKDSVYDFDLESNGQFGIVPKVVRLSFDFHPLHQDTIGYDNQASPSPNFPYNLPALKGIDNFEEISDQALPQAPVFDNIQGNPNVPPGELPTGEEYQKLKEEIEKRNKAILENANPQSGWDKVFDFFSKNEE